MAFNLESDDVQTTSEASRAVDLSDNEEEEDLEDLIEDFSLQADLYNVCLAFAIFYFILIFLNQDSDLRQERLYFFQFPAPFPKFRSSNTVPIDVDATNVGQASSTPKVAFAVDSKTPAESASSRTATAAESSAQKEKDTEAHVDGVIGQLEVYHSGAVKMRLGNGILLDVCIILFTHQPIRSNDLKGYCSNTTLLPPTRHTSRYTQQTFKCARRSKQAVHRVSKC
jgi:DNA-directed RNA polymerase III subunit RPC4